MVGTVYLLATPGLSAELFALLYKVVPTAVASCAWRMALPLLPNALASIAHTIAFVVPLAEMDGVAPGNVCVSVVWFGAYQVFIRPLVKEN